MIVTSRASGYLAVTFAVQRMVVIARSQRMSVPGQNEATGLA